MHCGSPRVCAAEAVERGLPPLALVQVNAPPVNRTGMGELGAWTPLFNPIRESRVAVDPQSPWASLVVVLRAGHFPLYLQTTRSGADTGEFLARLLALRADDDVTVPVQLAVQLLQ